MYSKIPMIQNKPRTLLLFKNSVVANHYPPTFQMFDFSFFLPSFSSFFLPQFCICFIIKRLHWSLKAGPFCRGWSSSTNPALLQFAVSLVLIKDNYRIRPSESLKYQRLPNLSLTSTFILTFRLWHFSYFAYCRFPESILHKVFIFLFF
jgi:hypothetical protein